MQIKCNCTAFIEWAGRNQNCKLISLYFLLHFLEIHQFPSNTHFKYYRRNETSHLCPDPMNFAWIFNEKCDHHHHRYERTHTERIIKRSPISSPIATAIDQHSVLIQHIESAMWLICSMVLLMMLMKNCPCDWWCDQMINYLIFMCHFKNRFNTFYNSIRCNKEIMKWLKDWIGLIAVWNQIKSNETKMKRNQPRLDIELVFVAFISFFSHNFQCNVRRASQVCIDYIFTAEMHMKKDEWRKMSVEMLVMQSFEHAINNFKLIY